MALIFVDCEADGPCPGKGVLTEFGAVEYATRETFHGILYESTPNPNYPGMSIKTGVKFDPLLVFVRFEDWLKKFKDRPIFVSDNPAYDFQWINYMFYTTVGRNPFGHSARRISDFYAGLVGDFYKTQEWKDFRVTPHDHNPVHDAMGNVEAFDTIMKSLKKAKKESIFRSLEIKNEGGG